jgi:two-component system, OmpR family, phosphate regulon sensor histidine kinase PhoR
MDATERILTMVGWSKSAMMLCSTMNKPIVYKLQDTGLWGDAVRERKPVITNDYPSLVKPTKKGYPNGRVRVRRHMNLPIMEGQHIVMVVGAGNKQEEYTLADAKALQTFMDAAWKTLKPRL